MMRVRKMGDAEIIPSRAKRAAIVGDSIVGFQSGYYTRKLNEYGLGIKFDQFGVGSDTTAGMKKRLQGVVGSGKYEELVIAGGVNDIAIYGGAGEDVWKRQVLPKLESNIREMVGIAKRGGVERIVLVEVAPWGGSPNWSPQKEARTLEYNAMLAAVAADTPGVGFVGLHKEMQGPEAGRMDRALSGRRKDGKADWLHPGERGLEMIAKRIAESAYSYELTSSVWNRGLKYENSGDYLERLKKTGGTRPLGKVASKY